MAPCQLASFCCSKRIWECNGLGKHETHESTELPDQRHLTTMESSRSSGQVVKSVLQTLRNCAHFTVEPGLSISCGIPSSNVLIRNFGESDKLQNPKMTAGQDLKSQLVLDSDGFSLSPSKCPLEDGLHALQGLFMYKFIGSVSR